MGRRCQVPDTGPGHRRSQSDRQLLRNIVYLRRHPAERGRRLARDGPGGGQRRVAQLRFLGHGHDHRQRQRCPRSQDDLRADQEHGQRPVHGLGRSFRCGRARRRQLLPLRVRRSHRQQLVAGGRGCSLEHRHHVSRGRLCQRRGRKLPRQQRPYRRFRWEPGQRRAHLRGLLQIRRRKAHIDFGRPHAGRRRLRQCSARR